MSFIDIGNGNSVSLSRIISVVSFEAAPIKRLVQDAKEAGMAIDACCGKKCQSVIVTDSKHIILSYMSAGEITSLSTDK